MPEKEKTVILDCVSNDEKIIRIKFTRSLLQTKSVAYLTAAIKKCFEHGFYRIIIDMETIESPTNQFIATLIEATSKARRKKGDIKLINLKEEARQCMAAFNAYYYLSIQSAE